MEVWDCGEFEKKYLCDFSSNDFLSDINMVGKFEEKLGVVHNDHDNFVDARRNVNDVLLQVCLFLNPGLQ